MIFGFNTVDKRRMTKMLVATILIFLIIGMLVVMVGCACPPTYPPAMEKEVQRNVERMDVFLDRAEAGEVTDKQIMDMLRANWKAWSLLMTLMEEDEDE